MTRVQRVLRRSLDLAIAAMLTGAVALPLLTHAAPIGGWYGSPAQVESLPPVPVNIPTWTAADAARFPHCSDKPVLGDVIVVDQRDHAERVSFRQAWTWTHNANRADDVWVVGWCR